MEEENIELGMFAVSDADKLLAEFKNVGCAFRAKLIEVNLNGCGASRHCTAAVPG